MASPRDSRKFPKVPFLAGFCVLAGLAATEASAPGRFEADAGVTAGEADAGPEQPVSVDPRGEGRLTVKAGPPVPMKPEPWQKVPPCDWEGAREVAIRGACYLRALDAQPPCPSRMFESEGKCVVAVARSPRPNTSIEQ